MLPFYLAFKEIVRNKSRFLSVGAVIGLITLLVLFVAALGEGLAQANKQYLEKIDAELIVFQEDVDLSIPTSRLSRGRLNNLNRVEGVEAVGPLGFSVASILLPDGENLDISIVGAEPGMPGLPEVTEGRSLTSRRADEIIVDQNILDQADFPIGSTMQIKVIQGTREEIYDLRVVGHTSGQQFQFLPSVFLPMLTWDQIRPQAAPGGSNDLSYNVAAVRVAPGYDWETVAARIEAEVSGVEVTDPVTTYESSPGYAAQQSTINTQKFFTLLIATLVIGGFFQIQTLQKIGQIGMLKAIGASNKLVSITLVVQVVIITVVGIGIGAAASFLFALFLPSTTPIKFEGPAVLTAVAILFAIGPIGGLVSIRTLLKVEPLTALGLGK